MRYVSPLALFLFTIFLMFFAASLGSSPPLHLDASDDAKAELYAELAKARTEVAEAQGKLDEARRTGGDVEDKAEDLADAKQELATAEMALRTIGLAASATDAAASGSAAASGTVGASAAASRALARPHKPGISFNVEKGYSDIRWLDRGIKHALANPELTIYKLKSSAYKYSFMLVPISLPFVWLLFLFRRGVTAYDHAIFVLYSLSFMSLLFVVVVALGALSVPTGLLVAIAVFVPPVHMGLQLRDTYGLGLWSTLWRTAALLVVATIVFLLFVMLIAYVVLA